MTGWWKYSEALRRVLYDDNADVSQLFTALNAVGADLVIEDKARVEHLARTHAEATTRGECLIALLGDFADPAWIEPGIEMLDDHDTRMNAAAALLMFRRKTDDPRIIPALARMCLRLQRYEWEGEPRPDLREWAEEKIGELLKLLGQPVPSGSDALFAEAERLSRSTII